MENEITFKQQYKLGLDLSKEDIEKCKNDSICVIIYIKQGGLYE